MLQLLLRLLSPLTFFLLLAIIPAPLWAQRLVDKNKGDHFQTKRGIMDGNLVQTVYYNFGEVADWLNVPTLSGVWPKGSGHTYVDGVAIIVQAETKSPAGQIIHPLETNYYEYTRHDPATGVTYGWWPLPGYANPFQSSPAQSSNPQTWPTHWPDRPADWDGFWNGFFGKGVQNADLETYFVFDDHEDREYILKHNFRPDREDPERGGLGMQVRARGFQWSQVLAEDVIFWFYEITNMSTTDYEKTLFAQYIDWGIGGHDNSSNNAGDYNEELDISYAWSTVPYGNPGNWSPVGYSGYAFLESPGISDDRRDNDDDGLTDERRDNAALNFIQSATQDPALADVAQDTLAFRRFYGYSWRPHWDADENASWQSFGDFNDNGEWDEGEPLNDDVGTDGIGPFDEGYTGPDADNTEANGKPDQGEPNFGILDKDESDQLGLTGFKIFPVHTPYDLNNDELNWSGLSALPAPHGQSLVGVNLANYFSCYLFHLSGRDTYSRETGTLQETGETERFSMALIFGIDTNDLFRRKRTVQQIYNANYRFAKPPAKPIVTAVPGDGRVTLYWDSRAEKTFDPFYQKFNFEGYRVYRSTEPNFLENKLITDAYGKATFRRPIAQFDLVDGVKGLHAIDVNGARFDLGNDTGLRHSFIDTTVQNGQTYYYAVVSYDQGFSRTDITGAFEGIPPSECPSIFKVDINGRVKADINTAEVTPRPPAAGYVKPQVKMTPPTGPGTGAVMVSILNPDSLRENHLYRLEFNDRTAFHNDAHPQYQLVDYTSHDTLVSFTAIKGSEEQTPVLHGFAVDIKNDSTVRIIQAQSKWSKGNSNYLVQLGFDSRYAPAYEPRRVFYPADFEITFTEKGEGDLGFPATSFSQRNASNIVVKNVTENIDHFQFVFRDNNNDSTFNAGDAIFFVSGDSAGKAAEVFRNARFSWSITLVKDTTIAEEQQRLPQLGDVFRLVTSKPFRRGEFFEFVTDAPSLDLQQAQSDLDKIAVVPNPYVGAASWEPFSTNVGRGERRIYFIHLPRECTIRLYTISGHLVQTLQHNSSNDDGQEAWNLVSRDGMDIAYGVYIFHVDAPGVGTKIGRFAVLK